MNEKKRINKKKIEINPSYPIKGLFCYIHGFNFPCDLACGENFVEIRCSHWFDCYSDKCYFKVYR